MIKIMRKTETSRQFAFLFMISFFLASCSILNTAREIDGGDSVGGTGGPNIIIDHVEQLSTPTPDGIVHLKIWLKNTGGEHAFSVDTTIEGQSHNTFYGDILAGETVPTYMNDHQGIYIPADSASGEVLEYTLHIEDDSENQWTDSFEIEVQ